MNHPTLSIAFDDATGRLSPIALRWLHASAAAVAHELSRRLHASGEARVRIVSDAEMATLHERHAGVPGATDVLTFDLRDPGPQGLPPAGPLDADILVCLDEAQRQASTRGPSHSPERELLLYSLHACLHCLGFDDQSDDDARRMHEAEDDILSAAGIGPVFGV